jgi:hypothetical protein
MVTDSEPGTPEKLIAVWVCPQCGKTVDQRRRYCSCRAYLAGASVKISEKPPEVGPCNFETSRVTCNDCYENCNRCYRFGSTEKDKNGFGGKECDHNTNRGAKCFCCQAQINIALRVKAELDFEKLILAKTEHNDGESPCFANCAKAMANLIQAGMENPVLNRINQNRQKAG